jgi:hypothetical protein
MNLRNLLLFALLTATTPACISNPSDSDDEADAGGGGGGGGGEQPPVEGDFQLTFVSGHLGNYWDCPEEANGAGAGTPDGTAGEAAGDAAAGACAPGFEDSCTGPLNCEAAMVIVEVRNTGEVPLGDLSIVSIELLGQDGDRETLEGLGVFSSTEPAPGPLAPGASRQVRVEFRGPASDSGNQFNGDAPERTLHIVLSGGDAGTAEVTTPAVYPLPAVAT